MREITWTLRVLEVPRGWCPSWGLAVPATLGWLRSWALSCWLEVICVGFGAVHWAPHEPSGSAGKVKSCPKSSLRNIMLQSAGLGEAFHILVMLRGKPCNRTTALRAVWEGWRLEAVWLLLSFILLGVQGFRAPSWSPYCYLPCQQLKGDAFCTLELVVILM